MCAAVALWQPVAVLSVDQQPRSLYAFGQGNRTFDFKKERPAVDDADSVAERGGSLGGAAAGGALVCGAARGKKRREKDQAIKSLLGLQKENPSYDCDHRTDFLLCLLGEDLCKSLNKLLVVAVFANSDAAIRVG